MQQVFEISYVDSLECRREMELLNGTSGLVEASSKDNLCLGCQPGAFSVCVDGKQCLLDCNVVSKNKTISVPKKIDLINHISSAP